jgi:hypothetical protein
MYVPAFTERGEARGRGFPEWVPMQLRMIADVGDVNKPGQMEAVFERIEKGMANSILSFTPLPFRQALAKRFTSMALT